MTGWFVIVLKYLRPTSHSPGSIVTRSPVICCDPGPLKVEMSVNVELNCLLNSPVSSLTVQFAGEIRLYANANFLWIEIETEYRVLSE